MDGRGWNGPLIWAVTACCFDRPSTGSHEPISFDDALGLRTRRPLSWRVELTGIGDGDAVFDSREGTWVEQLPLQQPGALRRRVHLHRRSSARRSQRSCSASAPPQAATILAANEVEVARQRLW